MAAWWVFLRLHEWSLWSALFEPKSPLWLSAACNKTKYPLMPDPAENTPARRRLLAPTSRTSETDARKQGAGGHANRKLTSPFPSSFFYIAVRSWTASETGYLVHSVLDPPPCFFLKENKTFSQNSTPTLSWRTLESSVINKLAETERALIPVFFFFRDMTRMNNAAHPYFPLPVAQTLTLPSLWIRLLQSGLEYSHGKKYLIRF